jgi:hypothetical protein
VKPFGTLFGEGQVVICDNDSSTICTQARKLFLQIKHFTVTEMFYETLVFALTIFILRRRKKRISRGTQTAPFDKRDVGVQTTSEVFLESESDFEMEVVSTYFGVESDDDISFVSDMSISLSGTYSDNLVTS